MTAARRQAKKREPINPRIERELPDWVDRGVIYVNENTYNEFLARLNAPPQPNERLLRLSRTKPPGKP